jgi:hypothetical protein
MHGRCDTAAALHQIVHQAHLVYGFENTSDCRPSSIAADPPPSAPALVANSGREALLSAVTPSLVRDHSDVPHARRIDRAVSVTFSGGTLMEALNELIRARHDAMWQVGFDLGTVKNRKRAIIMSGASRSCSSAGCAISETRL